MKRFVHMGTQCTNTGVPILIANNSQHLNLCPNLNPPPIPISMKVLNRQNVIRSHPKLRRHGRSLSVIGLCAHNVAHTHKFHSRQA